jgi:hypothetical protein
MSSQKRFLRIRPRGWLLTVPVVVALFLAYRLMGALTVDTLFSVNAGCQFALILVGVIVAVRPNAAVEHPWRVIAAFVLLGGIGMVAALRQQQISAQETAEAQRQAAEAGAKLSNNVENLNKGAAEMAKAQAEIARVQTLNTELQQRLLDSSGEILSQGKVISNLSQQAIDTTTGGGSFCYMSLTGDPNGKVMTPVFLHIGKHPLYDIRVRIVDFQRFDALQAGVQRPLTLDEFFATDTNLSLGDLPLQSSWVEFDRTIPFNTASSNRQDYRIFFNARNGYWSQDLSWEKVDGKWIMSTRVFRDVGVGKKKQVFQKLDKKFSGRWHN